MNFELHTAHNHHRTMASTEIIVIDDSSDDETPPLRPTATGAQAPTATASIGAPATAKRPRVFDDSTQNHDELPAIITPSLTDASAATAATNADSAAAAAPRSPGGAATTSAKKRPGPTLGQEAKVLDHALQRASCTNGTSKSPGEETVEISDPRQTIVDILGNCHAKISFGAGRGPMSANAIMGLPGLSVNRFGPVCDH